MFSVPLQEILKVVEVVDNSVRTRTQQNEHYLRKLISLSRYVTPCPDILDDLTPTNNNSSKLEDTDTKTDIKQTAGKSSCPSPATLNKFQFPECSESSDSSDESAWDSIPTPIHTGQWRNLIEYEASLLANMKDHKPMNIEAHHKEEPSSSLSSSELCLKRKTEIKSNLQRDDVTEVLNSIARSLERLESRSENSDMFGQYISHRLSELSEENRSCAEVEINQVLMKYVAKDVQLSLASNDQRQDTKHDGSKNTKNKGKKKKHIVK